MVKRIAVFTGSRAEYGLLKPLIHALRADAAFSVSLIVSGMHLSSEFGLSYREIEADGIPIAEKLEILLSSDTSVGAAKSMGLGLISFAEAFARLRPDLLIGLGDRFEWFAAASAAMVSRIPVAHIHGGESTFGLVDDAIRHAVSKMAQLHFTSTALYRRRLIQMGERPDRVFHVGSIGVDNIRSMRLLSRRALEQALNFKLGRRNIVVTFHPVTLQPGAAAVHLDAMFDALSELSGTHLIFTKSNADPEGRLLNEKIDHFVAKRPREAVAFFSLGQVRYFSLLAQADCMVGNSSSGIIEMPSFHKPTINVGRRQEGRVRAVSIIDCPPEKDAIAAAIHEAMSARFQRKLPRVRNPYDGHGAVAQIVAALKSADWSQLLNKRFCDVSFRSAPRRHWQK